MPAKRRAIIAARVSSEDSTNERIDAQLAECRTWAASNGYEVVGEIAENGVSGGLPISERPDLWKAIEQLRMGRIEAIIVRELDRLGRRLDTAALVEECEAYEDGIRFVRQPRQDDPEAEILQLGVGSVMARLERARIYRRTAAGRNARARSGRAAIGHLPTWITKADDDDGHQHLTLIPAKAERIVALLEGFEGGTGGHTLITTDLASAYKQLRNPAVAGRLYVRPLPVRPIGKAIAQRQRRDALRHIVACATVEEADAKADDLGMIAIPVPALIGWPRFAAIQTRLESARSGRRGRPASAPLLPLQGRVYCSRDGLAFSPRRERGQPVATCTARYGASQARRHGKCTVPRIPWAALVTRVDQAVSAALRTPQAIERAVNDALAVTVHEIDQLTASVGDVDARIVKLREKRARAAGLWVDGIWDDQRWQRERRTLDKEIGALEERRRASADAGDRLESLQRQRLFMESGVSLIHVSGDASAYYGHDIGKLAAALDLHVYVQPDGSLRIDGAIPLGEASEAEAIEATPVPILVTPSASPPDYTGALPFRLTTARVWKGGERLAAV